MAKCQLLAAYQGDVLESVLAILQVQRWGLLLKRLTAGGYPHLTIKLLAEYRELALVASLAILQVAQ